MLQIPQNIKAARVLKGLTQKQTADLLHVKRSTYANWETNTAPGIDDLKIIAQVLDTNLSSLLGEDSISVDKPINEVLSENAEGMIKMEADIIALKLYVSELISERQKVSFADAMTSIQKVATEQANRLFDEYKRVRKRR